METATATAVTTRCSWPPCCREIGPGDSFVLTRDGALHGACARQQLDEDELFKFLDQVARDAAGKIVEFRDLHPTRVNEHKARPLLMRLEAVIAAAVR